MSNTFKRARWSSIVVPLLKSYLADYLNAGTDLIDTNLIPTNQLGQNANPNGFAGLVASMYTSSSSRVTGVNKSAPQCSFLEFWIQIQLQVIKLFTGQ